MDSTDPKNMAPGSPYSSQLDYLKNKNEDEISVVEKKLLKDLEDLNTYRQIMAQQNKGQQTKGYDPEKVKMSVVDLGQSVSLKQNLLNFKNKSKDRQLEDIKNQQR